MSANFDSENIPANPFLVSPQADPDKYTANCIEDAVLHHYNLRNKGLRQDLKARKKYARRSFWLVVWWVCAMFVLLVLQGFLGYRSRTISGSALGVSFNYTEPKIFFLSENVLMATIGGTTASIIGIFMVVMKNLFPAPRSMSEPPTSSKQT